MEASSSGGPGAWAFGARGRPRCRLSSWCGNGGRYGVAGHSTTAPASDPREPHRERRPWQQLAGSHARSSTVARPAPRCSLTGSGRRRPGRRSAPVSARRSATRRAARPQLARTAQTETLSSADWLSSRAPTRPHSATTAIPRRRGSRHRSASSERLRVNPTTGPTPSHGSGSTADRSPREGRRDADRRSCTVRPGSTFVVPTTARARDVVSASNACQPQPTGATAGISDPWRTLPARVRPLAWTAASSPWRTLRRSWRHPWPRSVPSSSQGTPLHSDRRSAAVPHRDRRARGLHPAHVRASRADRRHTDEAPGHRSPPRRGRGPLALSPPGPDATRST